MSKQQQQLREYLVYVLIKIQDNKVQRSFCFSILDNRADSYLTCEIHLMEGPGSNSMRRNSRVVDVREPRSFEHGDSSAIAGYAQEPLLPLSKACAPLVDIVYNLLFYIQMATNEISEVPADGLTMDESAAIRLYTIEWEEEHASLYTMLNKALKKGIRDDLQPYFKYMKLLLTALAKLPHATTATVWRGVTRDLSDRLTRGTQVTWWSFSSCTTQLTVLENNRYLGSVGERTLFSIETINGRSIKAHSHYQIEDEILLLPGTQMIVQSQFTPAPGLHIIHLKQVIPKEVLLEPPFEGKFNILQSFPLVFILRRALVYKK